MANTESVRLLEQTCKAIVELEPKKDSFINRPQWGAITFEKIGNDIETVFWLAQETQQLPTHILPDSIVQNTISYLSSIKDTLDQIDGFTISQGDPSSLRDQLEAQFAGQLENTMSAIGVWLPVLALRAGEIENWAARMKDASAEATRILQETAEYAESRKTEIQGIAEAARVAAGEAGAAEFTRQFDDESEIGEKRVERWLWPTGIFSALALALAFMLMFGLLGEVPKNVWEAVYGLGGRIIAISVLFYAAVWSGRIVLANMHLASVNKHRALSLQTLQAFHKAAEDAAAKDAVVLEAARAVYENVPSGYIGRQSADGIAGTRTLELIRNARATPSTDGS